MRTSSPPPQDNHQPEKEHLNRKRQFARQFDHGRPSRPILRINATDLKTVMDQPKFTPEGRNSTQRQHASLGLDFEGTQEDARLPCMRQLSTALPKPERAHQ